MKIMNRKNQVVGLMIICICAANAVANDEDSVPNNIQDKIRKILSTKDDSDLAKNISVLLYLVNGNKIYAEGSSGTGNKGNFEISNNLKNVKPTIANIVHQIQKSDGKNIDHIYHDANNKSDSSFTNKTGGDVPFEKWKEKNLSPLLGLDDVAQANGTSSIKPRKGVNYYKDEAEDSLVDDLPFNYSCFVADKSKCYDVEHYKHLNCSCCKMGNDLGKTIELQPLVDCSSCLPVNKVTFNAAKACNHICCQNYSASVTRQYIYDNGNETISRNHSTGYEVYENNSNLPVNKNDSNSNNTRLMKKLKPSITSVPYDLDNARNFFNKSKSEKYVPKVISIFILPLVGILIYVLWKKTREFWDRRYYKRMDFLIDGIYND